VTAKHVLVAAVLLGGVLGVIGHGALGARRRGFPPRVALIAGGVAMNDLLSSAEVFDPKTGTFTATTPMSAARFGLTVTGLDRRFALVAGGFSQEVPVTEYVTRGEIYDRAIGAFLPTRSMQQGRIFHQATRLDASHVLITGGQTTVQLPDGRHAVDLQSAELFDRADGTFAAVGDMADARSSHVAAALGSTTVLVAGGIQEPDVLATAEIYSVKTKSFRAIAPMASPRANGVAVSLGPRFALVCGGTSDEEGRHVLSSAELFDLRSEGFVTIEPMFTAREAHTATLLSGGLVLICGGVDDTGSVTAAAELFDVRTRRFITIGPMHVARAFHVAIRLGRGRVLVAGGAGANDSVLDSAEVFDLASRSFSMVGSMTMPRYLAQGAAFR